MRSCIVVCSVSTFWLQHQWAFGFSISLHLLASCTVREQPQAQMYLSQDPVHRSLKSLQKLDSWVDPVNDEHVAAFNALRSTHKRITVEHLKKSSSVAPLDVRARGRVQGGHEDGAHTAQRAVATQVRTRRLAQAPRAIATEEAATDTCFGLRSIVSCNTCFGRLQVCC